MTALQYITIRGPQFTSDPRLTSLITAAASGLSSNVLGDRYQEALALKVLHWLTLEQMAIGSSASGAGTSSGIVVGNISAIKEGGLSISFNQNTVSSSIKNNPELSSTQFGIELATLLKMQVNLSALSRI